MRHTMWHLTQRLSPQDSEPLGAHTFEPQHMYTYTLRLPQTDLLNVIENCLCEILLKWRRVDPVTMQRPEMPAHIEETIHGLQLLYAESSTRVSPCATSSLKRQNGCRMRRTITSTPELVALWRSRANDLRTYASCTEAATAYEFAARELETALASKLAVTLSINEAAVRVSRHPDTIRKAISDGKLTNAGRRGKPAVILRDLLERFPVKAVATDSADTYSRGADALFALVGGRGEAA